MNISANCAPQGGKVRLRRYQRRFDYTLALVLSGLFSWGAAGCGSDSSTGGPGGEGADTQGDGIGQEGGDGSLVNDGDGSEGAGKADGDGESGGNPDSGDGDTTSTADGTEDGSPDPDVVASGSATIGASGGTLSITGFELVVPAGALAEDTIISVQRLDTVPPAGYEPWSPLFSVEPADLMLATPASVTIAYEGSGDTAAMFWSRTSTLAYAWRGGEANQSQLTSWTLSLGTTFVGNGGVWTDPVDPTCVGARLYEGYTHGQSTVAALFGAEDCHGSAAVGLGLAAFSFSENDSALSEGDEVVSLEPAGLHLFVVLLLDLEFLSATERGALIEGASAFVDQAMVQWKLPIHVGIDLVYKEPLSAAWQKPTLNAALLKQRLNDLSEFDASGIEGVELGTAIIDAIERVAPEREVFRVRQKGGALTATEVLVFSNRTADGGAGGTVAQAAMESGSRVRAIGLGGHLQTEALRTLSTSEPYVATHAGGLGAAYRALANRVRLDSEAAYFVAYCSALRSGLATLYISPSSASPHESAEFMFDTSSFVDGCSAEGMVNLCEGQQCGGLGCGVCDDQTQSCGVGNKCYGSCAWANACGGATIVNPAGYEVVCEDTLELTSCSGTCHNLMSANMHCGKCGQSCPAGASCIEGECECPAGKQACENPGNVTGSSCFYTDSNPGHCGGCGSPCPAGQACVGPGECEPFGVQTMIKIPAGPFWMGCVGFDCVQFEKPAREVNVPEFYIDATEVTLDEYKVCSTAGACPDLSVCADLTQKDGSSPAVCVNAAAAQAYCGWYGKRLPTEAEWEKAARGGCELYPEGACKQSSPHFPWGIQQPICGLHGIFSGCLNSATKPVGSCPIGASPYGVLDMSGNVSEWVEDCWHDDFTGAPVDGSAWVTDCSSTERVIRGANYSSAHFQMRTTFRTSTNPAAGSPMYGFRCAMSSK